MYRVTDALRVMKPRAGNGSEKIPLRSNNGLVSAPRELKFTEEDEVTVCSSFVIKVSTRLSTDEGWDLC
jgi:hypothetical protein